MSEFKIPPYLYFYPSDWLNDPEVRRLPEGPKSFYIDLLCQMHFTFPYGYCSLLNPQKSSKLQKQVNQKSNQEVNLRVELLLSLSVVEQLKLAENIEQDLSKYLPYSQEQIQQYIRVLEERTIISRSSFGILYSRRMVKDFKKRVTAYLNGTKGGNPGIKLKKKAKKQGENIVGKILKDNKLRNQVNQKGNRPGYSTADLHNNNNNVGREGVGPAGENPVFEHQGLYEKKFSDLQKEGYSKHLTEVGFNQWKKFVDFCAAEKKYQDIFVMKFLKPEDFEELWREKGFITDHWKPVVEKMLSSGTNPRQNMYYRIPQFMKYLKIDIQPLQLSETDDDYKINLKDLQNN